MRVKGAILTGKGQAPHGAQGRLTRFPTTGNKRPDQIGHISFCSFDFFAPGGAAYRPAREVTLHYRRLLAMLLDGSRVGSGGWYCPIWLAIPKND